MTNTQLLLDRARKLCSPPTWYELAKSLAMHPQAVYKVMKRGGGIANGPAFRLAKLLDMDAATVVAYIEEDRAPAAEKDFWRAQLPRLLATAGLAVAVAVTFPQGSAALKGDPVAGDNLYIMRTCARLRRSWHSLRGIVCRLFAPNLAIA